MEPAAHPRVDWKLLFSQRGFRYFFVGIFVSLFGSGMNFAGVTWYVLSSTHSTLSVGFTVILYTLPWLICPPWGSSTWTCARRAQRGRTWPTAA